MQFRLKIEVNGTPTYTAWVAETNGVLAQAMAQARYANPTAKISVERQTSAPAPPPVSNGGIARVQDDSTPTLGGDLNLNGHHIVGVVMAEVTVVDGGLLG